MKVAVITSGILPVPAVEGGAVENLIDYYIEANEASGKHEITVFSVHPHGELSMPRCYKHAKFEYVNISSFLSRLRRVIFSKYHTCYFYHPYVEYFLFRILHKVKQGGFDLVVLENRPAFAPLIRKNTSARILIHLHTDTINMQQTLAREWLDSADGVLAISDYIRQQVLKVKPNMPVSVVYNGIRLDDFVHAAPYCRSELGLKEDDFVLVYCGRIIPEKGVEHVIEAMLKLTQEGVDVKLLVVGGQFYGHDRQPSEYVTKIKQQCRPIMNKIFFTGFVAYDRIPCYMKACNVAVLPSLCEEAFGLTMLESMSCGLPVITTNAGGIPEVCEGAAIVLERNDNLSESIAASVKVLKEDKAKLNGLKELALERSMKFSVERYSQAMLKALK